MEHTPGPWIVGNSDTREGRAVWADGGIAGPARVAICPLEFTAHDANARLIAAAPELLSSLQDILKELPDSFFGGHPLLTERAEKVVAAATGNLAQLFIEQDGN